MVGAALGYAAGRAMQSLLAGLPPRGCGNIRCLHGGGIDDDAGGSLIPTIRAMTVDPAVAVRAK